MPQRNEATWNTMISVLSRVGLYSDAFVLFGRMRDQGFEMSGFVIASLLTGCAGSGDMVDQGVQVHGTALLNFYTKYGFYDSARGLFDEMPEKNVVSWTSLMVGHSDNGNFEEVVKANECGYEYDLCVANSLISMFGNLGMVKEACYVFDGMSLHDTISWNSMISVYALCDVMDDIIWGVAVHGLVHKLGLDLNLSLCNTLLGMYSEARRFKEMVKLFKEMPDKDLISWNSLIAGYAQYGDRASKQPDCWKCVSHDVGEAKMMRKAERVFERMPERDLVTWNTLIGGYADCEETDQAIKLLCCFQSPAYHGMPLHAHVIRSGLDLYDYVKNSLMTMYSKCKDLNSSTRIFDGLLNKDYVSWNAMVAANAHHGNGEQALKTFSEMIKSGILLDHFGFYAALAAAADLSTLEEGQRSNTRAHVVWNILISAYARQESFQDAQDVFHEMMNTGLKPNHVTFVSLLSACSHGGLVDEVLEYYSLMTAKYGVPVSIEHCVCIIDLLGRSGRLTEAENFINKYAACRIHGNSQLGKRALNHLLESNPSDESAFVLYSNVCATSGEWEAVHDLRVEMESSYVKKKPACSWIKLKRKASSFAIGDKSHPHNDKIYSKLYELKKMVKEAGYVPDISYSLQNIDEEQKEDHIWKHSQRLALAYGLINTPEGSDLQIFKNLQVCGYCHSAFKFISNIVKRKIILKYPFRFHHFSDAYTYHILYLDYTGLAYLSCNGSVVKFA
ncbi:tetratricopeptide repeat (TPR)-like superfamily protein [Artemisia annua]|uniref:Tetratricopeptide repeat (TPR)-like superfamily protein n=1 Tax=Artemisia annua TaxID=35608 RepID=A0A2U1PAS8_ARTAN|nr:tetratricopeptide repeat (TPR)-like superfamily protein [Artemisia annua]